MNEVIIVWVLTIHMNGLYGFTHTATVQFPTKAECVAAMKTVTPAPRFLPYTCTPKEKS